ncbi:TonB-dependent receptor [uncultured Hyphomonas sp.]|uniref:TonB-dependent receptor n=1 Tax=uncultured Hyphomonas sp. TaxID=225298 RepID=UPI002AABF08E|nr:TonB-dependent receptor [uncultured Hyphomonas sp.]
MRSVCLFLLTCAAAVLPAAAQTHSLRVPDMPLADAINLLAEQTDTVIIAEAEDLDGLAAGPLTGDMEVGEALEALLSGIPLSVSQDANGVWIIRRKPAQTTSSEKPAPVASRIRPRRMPAPAMDLPRTYDTIIVTGSRAGLQAWESLSPVDVLDRADLAAPVSDDFADVLADIVPSFFVQRRPLSDGAVFVRPYSLRNLSADHTLILLNGKRRHRSAMLNTGGSQSPDLSKIPTNAIQRVEILRDGASAQYGSDAIAGVINIITRDDEMREGVAQYSQYYEGDGVQKRFGFGGGIRGPEGGVRLNLDYSDASPTSRARQRLDALEYLEDHPDADISDPVQKWGQPEREDFRGLLTADRITGFGQVYGLVNASQGQGVSDFNWRSPATPSVYAASAAFGDWSLINIYPNGFTPQFGQEERDVSATLGLKGEWAAGLTYDFSAGFGQNRIDYFLYDTINASMGPDSPTQFDAGGLRQQEFNLSADFQARLPAPSTFAEPVNLAFGIEHRVERYSVVAGEPASYEIGPGAIDGLTSGSNGFPGYTQVQAKTHEQSNWAVYADAEMRPGRYSQMGAALRFEEFDTFGSRLNGKLSYRRDVLPGLALRTTVSTGFKAPTPAQIFSERTSQGVAPDTLDVMTNGRFSPTGAVASILSERTDVDIASLRPETSVNLSAGGVFRPLDGLVASADVYRTDVQDRIFTSESYTLDALERARLAALGVPGGESITEVSFYQNSFDTRTTGIDLVMDYDRRLDGGDLTLGLSFNYNNTKVLNADFIANPSRISRFERLYPRVSTNASVGFAKGRWSFDTRFRWIGPWVDYTNQDGAPIQEFGSELFVDASVSVQLNDLLTLCIGAENLFDEYPDEAVLEVSKGLIYSRNAPYDTDGGQYFLRLSARF